jgi:hypothetical protein
MFNISAYRRPSWLGAFRSRPVVVAALVFNWKAQRHEGGGVYRFMIQIKDSPPAPAKMTPPMQENAQ